jgi:hypothetical protein
MRASRSLRGREVAADAMRSHPPSTKALDGAGPRAAI